MADGEVKIDTKLDTNGLDKGLKDMKNKLNDAGKQTDAAAKKTKGFSDNLKNLNAGAIATAAGMAGASVAIKKTVDALNDCAAAYRVQKKAEESLQIAAKNNPYLNEESVYKLRNFASELQSLSEIGDEVSLQVMSQLAATGRNEEQIMQIMSAAADMAAVTGQDIASAAQQLNATLNGNAGALGRQIGAINNLTKEELENGKAIELVAQQYKGSAAATADVGIQLSNAWGDFKENIGKNWDTVTKPVKQFFLDIITDINNAGAAARDLKGAKDANASGNGTALTYKKELDEEIKSLEKLTANAARAQELLTLNNKELKKTAEYTEFTMWAESSNPIQDFKDLQNQIINYVEVQQKKVDELTNKYNELTNAEKEAADAAAAKEKADQLAKEAADRDEAAIKYINENKKALEAQIKALELKAAATGEEVDEQAIYNAYLQSYIDLVTKSNGLVSENNSAAKERLVLLEKEAEKLKEITDAEERKAQAEKVAEIALDLIKEEKDERLQLITDINNNEILKEEEKRAAIEKINKAIAEDQKKIDDEMAENRRQKWSKLAEEINSYSQQVNDIIQNAAAMALETEKNRMTAELANLEILYRKGEIGEEEYQEKVADAKKKGAKIQYQIEMGQWAANILAAQANTAVGVTQALAQGGVAGIITGALVGAAGAVQLASIIAAKPIPHFATGGFIGGMNGASMGGDNTLIAARGGELMVNAAQQRQLWDVLNGNSGGIGGNVNLIVNNSASNLVTTNAQIDRNKIELMIDARVNDGLKKGRFNAGLNAANASMSGDFYGI